MRALLPIAAAGFVLAGCQSAKFDDTIQSNLRAICPVVEQAHDAFLVVAAAKPSIAEQFGRKEAQAYAALSVACADPSNVTSRNILVYIASAFAAWQIAGVV
jgi:hypothetical protein